MTGERYWGIDLGGTKIEGAVVVSAVSPETTARLRVDTGAENGYDHILAQIAHLVDMLADSTGERPEVIGVGHPGVLDPVTHLIKNSNTQCLNKKPLQKDLEALLGLPAKLANDANCFALAEATLGAGRGGEVVFGVIMGTGVGGGVVIGGEALYGAQGISGEWGHNVLDWDGPPCYCGKRGCVEAMISGPALQNEYSKRTGSKASMEEIYKRHLANSDASATMVIEELLQNFGKAISTIINILDPHFIVLGGGLSNIELLYSRGLSEASRYVFNDSCQTKIVKNQLGDSAGVFGAAMLTA